MKLINTSQFPDELVREIINFARPSGTRNFTVNVRDSTYRFSGHCSYDTRYIALTIGRENHGNRSYPVFITYGGRPKEVVIKGKKHTFEKQKGYLDFLTLDDVECLVHLVAHEMFHLKQYDDPRCHRVWGSRGKQSERACDAYGIRKMREWRKLHPKVYEGGLDIFSLKGWQTDTHLCLECKQMFPQAKMAAVRTSGFKKKKNLELAGLCEPCFVKLFRQKGNFYSSNKEFNWRGGYQPKWSTEKYSKEMEQITKRLYPWNYEDMVEVPKA